jgi:hypothetical protein
MYDHLNLEQTTYQIPNTVSDLWWPNSKDWDSKKIVSLFGQQTMEVLLKVPVIVGDGPDILCWKLNSDGLCSSKSAYKMLAMEEAAAAPPTNIPTQVVQILRQVWADKTMQPRVKIFAWRLLRLALGTASRIHRNIPSIEETCSRCGLVENEAHLFFECSFANAVWFASTLGLRTHALPSSGRGIHLQISSIMQQAPSQATANLIFSIMWCLWKSRNDHRFNKIFWSPLRVLHKAWTIEMSYNLAYEDISNAAPPHLTNNNNSPQCTHPILQMLPSRCLMDQRCFVMLQCTCKHHLDNTEQALAFSF